MLTAPAACLDATRSFGRSRRDFCFAPCPRYAASAGSWSMGLLLLRPGGCGFASGERGDEGEQQKRERTKYWESREKRGLGAVMRMAHTMSSFLHRRVFLGLPLACCVHFAAAAFPARRNTQCAWATLQWTTATQHHHPCRVYFGKCTLGPTRLSRWAYLTGAACEKRTEEKEEVMTTTIMAVINGLLSERAAHAYHRRPSSLHFLFPAP